MSKTLTLFFLKSELDAHQLILKPAIVQKKIDRECADDDEDHLADVVCSSLLHANGAPV